LRIDDCAICTPSIHQRYHIRVEQNGYCPFKGDYAFVFHVGMT
jgi:hypothetical protein